MLPNPAMQREAPLLIKRIVQVVTEQMVKVDLPAQSLILISSTW